jgi:hypothetical protein
MAAAYHHWSFASDLTQTFGCHAGIAGWMIVWQHFIRPQYRHVVPVWSTIALLATSVPFPVIFLHSEQHLADAARALDVLAHPVLAEADRLAGLVQAILHSARLLAGATEIPATV